METNTASNTKTTGAALMDQDARSGLLRGFRPIGPQPEINSYPVGKVPVVRLILDETAHWAIQLVRFTEKGEIWETVRTFDPEDRMRAEGYATAYAEVINENWPGRVWFSDGTTAERGPSLVGEA